MPDKPDNSLSVRHLALLIGFLLLGALLRIHGLAPMSDMLHHDEAMNGLDALSLLEQPRLTPYFPANTGREGLWFYLLAPSVAVFGATPFALRLVAIFTSVVTLAAVYPLASDVLNRRRAVWVVGALAVMYWPVHIGHVAFRVNLFLCLGLLMWAVLLRTRRTQRGWWLMGALIGLTAYTYTAARVWIALAGLMFLGWLWRVPSVRRGTLKAMFAAGVVALPLLVALFFSPENTQHIQGMLVTDAATLQENLLNWLRAWTIAGDANPNHNLPLRPVLDVPLALLAGMGVLGAWKVVRERSLITWWVLLVLVSAVPTLLAIQTPHYLRGAGLILPLVLLIGSGAAFLVDIAPRKTGVLAASLLIAWAGFNTYSDFSRWLDTQQIGYLADPRLNQALTVSLNDTPAESPLIVPGIPFHPVLEFRTESQPQRNFYSFDWSPGTCYLSPREPYIVLDFPHALDSFAQRITPYATETTAIAQHPDNRYHVYQITPTDTLAQSWSEGVTAGELFRLRAIPPQESRLQSGDTVTFHLATRVMQAPQRPYQLFVHLYGETDPQSGGDVLSNGDTALCDLVYRPDSTGNVTLVQPLQLPIPKNLSAGTYRVAIGLYHLESGDVLPLRDASGNLSYYETFSITVTP